MSNYNVPPNLILIIKDLERRIKALETAKKTPTIPAQDQLATTPPAAPSA